MQYEQSKAGKDCDRLRTCIVDSHPTRVPWSYSSRMVFPLVPVYMAEDTKHWPCLSLQPGQWYQQVVQAVHGTAIPASRAHSSSFRVFGSEGFNMHVNSAGDIHLLELD